MLASLKCVQGQRCQSASPPVAINESPQAHTANTSNSHLKSIGQSLMFQYISLAEIPTLGKVTEFLRYWARRSYLARSQPFPGSFIILTLWRPSLKEDGFRPKNLGSFLWVCDSTNVLEKLRNFSPFLLWPLGFFRCSQQPEWQMQKQASWDWNRSLTLASTAFPCLWISYWITQSVQVVKHCCVCLGQFSLFHKLGCNFPFQVYTVMNP